MQLRIGIPVAHFHKGNPGQYVQRALTSMGHEAKVLSQYEFYTAFREGQFDFYFCVDSGGPLNLFESSIAECDFSKVAFWMIDYRRGKTLKNPNDADTCRYLGNKGGWIFQAQYEDFVACKQEATERVSWLPLAADEEIWNSEPAEEIRYDLGFIGNTWDETREHVLRQLRSLYRVSPSDLWLYDASKVMRQSKIAFNISSFYGDKSIDFDWNMRGPESLACGKPLVTNYIPSLDQIFKDNPLPNFIKIYNDVNSILPVVASALQDQAFLDSGPEARQWILENGTYKHAMGLVFDRLKILGVKI